MCVHVLHRTRFTVSESKCPHVLQMRFPGSTRPVQVARSHRCHPASNNLWLQGTQRELPVSATPSHPGVKHLRCRQSAHLVNLAAFLHPGVLQIRGPDDIAFCL